MAKEFENALTNPGSIAARRALAIAWRASDDPRADFLEKALLDHAFELDASGRAELRELQECGA